MQTTEENTSPLVDRLRTQLVMSMFVSREELYREQERQRRAAADEIEDLQGRNFVNRNAIRFMRVRLDLYKSALEAIADGEGDAQEIARQTLGET